MLITIKHLNRTVTLTIHFYKLLAWYNIAFTMVMQTLMGVGGIPLNRSSFLFSKLGGFTIAVLLHGYVNKEQYFYFRNAGYSIRKLFIYTLALDLCVYLLIAFTCLN